MGKGYAGKPAKLLIESLWIFFIASLLHFCHSVTGWYPLSFVCAVNESVWEHIKIIFFAALFYNIFYYFRLYKGNSCFIAGLSPSLFSILLSVPILFYGYTGLLGYDALIPDLLTAYLAAFICQLILDRFISKGKDCGRYRALSILFILLMISAFFVFTWYPPRLPLFTPPK